MRRQLTGDEYAAKLRNFDHAAFRLEVQPAYASPDELELVAQFKAGRLRPPDEVPALNRWFAQVRAQVAHGKTIGRVRIHDEPLTDYQRLERWADPWNLDAGEHIRYLTRRRALDIGLLPAAGPHDWWLLDDRELLVMVFNSDHRMVGRELITDPEHVAKAAKWRDLAVHHSVPSTTRHHAA